MSQTLLVIIKFHCKSLTDLTTCLFVSWLGDGLDPKSPGGK